MISRPPEYRFLIDVNLPKFFLFFNSEGFEHVVDINPSFTDTEIWEYALKNDLVIVSKDTDFYNRFLMHEDCPKIIYLKIGNTTLHELHVFFENNWQMIVDSLNTASMVIVYKTHIKVIS